MAVEAMKYLIKETKDFEGNVYINTLLRVFLKQI